VVSPFVVTVIPLQLGLSVSNRGQALRCCSFQRSFKRGYDVFFFFLFFNVGELCLIENWQRTQPVPPASVSGNRCDRGAHSAPSVSPVADQIDLAVLVHGGAMPVGGVRVVLKRSERWDRRANACKYNANGPVVAFCASIVQNDMSGRRADPPWSSSSPFRVRSSRVIFRERKEAGSTGKV